MTRKIIKTKDGGSVVLEKPKEKTIKINIPDGWIWPVFAALIMLVIAIIVANSLYNSKVQETHLKLVYLYCKR